MTCSSRIPTSPGPCWEPCRQEECLGGGEDYQGPFLGGTWTSGDQPGGDPSRDYIGGFSGRPAGLCPLSSNGLLNMSKAKHFHHHHNRHNQCLHDHHDHDHRDHLHGHDHNHCAHYPSWDYIGWFSMLGYVPLVRCPPTPTTTNGLLNMFSLSLSMPSSFGQIWSFTWMFVNCHESQLCAFGEVRYGIKWSSLALITFPECPLTFVTFSWGHRQRSKHQLAMDGLLCNSAIQQFCGLQYNIIEILLKSETTQLAISKYFCLK